MEGYSREGLCSFIRVWDEWSELNLAVPPFDLFHLLSIFHFEVMAMKNYSFFCLSGDCSTSHYKISVVLVGKRVSDSYPSMREVFGKTQ